MLSDYRPNYKARRTAKNKRGLYTDAMKLEAAKLYLITGSPTQTAAALNMPIETLKIWRKSRWWNELIEEIKTEGTIQLSAKLRKIAEKSLEVTLDRLENGDFMYDPKTSTLVRKPVLMRDAHRVASDLIDKSLELDRKPVQEEALKVTQDRLAALAATFAGFAKKVKRIEVIDVEPHAIQIPSSETLDVFPETRDGETVGEGNSKD